MVKHKLLIIEEQAILRLGLSTLLGLVPDFDIVGEYDTLSQALPVVVKLAPDLVITDFDPNQQDEANSLRALKELSSTTQVMILTDKTQDEAIRAALRSGANGYLLKDTNSTELMTAVRSLLAGKNYLSPSISGKVINAFLVADKANVEKQHLNLLTEREREILQRIAEGHTNRHIATQLNLSVKTVEKHRSNLMRKLNLHNISALTQFAIGHGLIQTAHRS